MSFRLGAQLPPAIGLDALSVASPGCLASCSSFSLLVLFCSPTRVDPQKPYANPFPRPAVPPKPEERPLLSQARAKGADAPGGAEGLGWIFCSHIPKLYIYIYIYIYIYGCGSKPMGSYFGVGAPMVVHSSWDWDVRWGYGILTHGHMGIQHALCAYKYLHGDTHTHTCVNLS